MSAIISNILFSAIMGIVLFYIIPFVRRNNLVEKVAIAVKAAQQIFPKEETEKKFEYVKTWIQATFSISDEDLKKYIESAVFELKQKNS